VAQHSPSFSALSPLLQEQAQRHWQRLLDLAPDYGELPEATRQTLMTLLALSDFVADSLIKQPELLGPLLASGDLDPPVWRMKRRSSATCASSGAVACW